MPGRSARYRSLGHMHRWAMRHHEWQANHTNDRKMKSFHEQASKYHEEQSKHYFDKARKVEIPTPKGEGFHNEETGTQYIAAHPGSNIGLGEL